MNEDLANRFIESATRSLESDPPVRDEARGELMGRLAQSHASGNEAELEATLNRLQKAAPTPWKWSGVLISGAVLLVLAVLLAIQIFAVVPELKLSKIALGKGGMQSWFNSLPASDRDFISIGNSKGFYSRISRPDHEVLSDLERYRQAYPDDPAIYECYALEFIELKNTLPPGYHETWQRIDPGNGIWNLWAAAVKTMGGAGTHTSGDIAGRVRLLEAALSAERLDTRMPELRVRRMAKFPTFPETYIGNAALLRLADSVKESRSDVTLVASLISALFHLEGTECWTTRDQARLKSLIASWRKVSPRLLLESSNYNDFQSKLYLLSMGTSLASFAKGFNLAAEEKELNQLMREIDRIAPIGLKKGKPAGRYGMVKIHPTVIQADGASTLAKRRAEHSSIEDPPEAYVPGKRSENAALERFLALASAILLIPALALVWFESFRRGKSVNGIADGIAPLLRWTDMAWTLAMGCLVPLLWYWVITRLTPLGLRDVTFSSSSLYQTPSLQGLSVLLLSSTLMLQSAQWRIRDRLRFLGLAKRHLWIGWVIACLAALILPLLGAMRWLPPANQESFFIGLAAACGIPLLWLLWQAGALLFSPGSSALGGVLQSRMLIAPLALTCGLMIGFQPLLKSIEQHWLALDEITRCDLSKGGIPPAESRKVEELARKLAAVLEDES